MGVTTIEKPIDGSKDISQLSRDLPDRDLLEVREDIYTNNFKVLY
jgi:hypothetical protein